MQRLSYSQWFYASVLAVTVACAPGGEPKSPKVQGCDSSNPCASGQSCVDGHCKAGGCTTDGDCGGQAACIEGACANRDARRAAVPRLRRDGSTADTAASWASAFHLCPRDGDRCPGPARRVRLELGLWVGARVFNGTCTPVLHGRQGLHAALLPFRALPRSRMRRQQTVHEGAHVRAGVVHPSRGGVDCPRVVVHPGQLTRAAAIWPNWLIVIWYGEELTP